MAEKNGKNGEKQITRISRARIMTEKLKGTKKPGRHYTPAPKINQFMFFPKK